MRRRFRISPAGKGPHDPWFHIGTLEVTTSMAVVLLSVVGIVLRAFSEQLTAPLVLDPQKVLEGQVWRIVTWPFAYVDLSFLFWEALTIFFFWYFGTEIERDLLGRVRFTKFLVWSTIVLGLLLVGMDAAIPTFIAVPSGLDTLQLMVLLLWIAEWPNRRFMFNVPAWLFGVVIVGISVLQYLATRQGWLLLHFLVGIVLCALIARHYGALAEHHWVPNLHRPHRQPRQKKQRKAFDPGRPTVVTGPWDSPVEHRVSKDEARMNALLDKIHASGTNSLTDKERAELLELRERLRRR